MEINQIKDENYFFYCLLSNREILRQLDRESPINNRLVD